MKSKGLYSFKFSIMHSTQMEIVRYWTMMVLKVIPIHLDLKKCSYSAIRSTVLDQYNYHKYEY